MLGDTRRGEQDAANLMVPLAMPHLRGQSPGDVSSGCDIPLLGFYSAPFLQTRSPTSYHPPLISSWLLPPCTEWMWHGGIQRNVIFSPSFTQNRGCSDRMRHPGLMQTHRGPMAAGLGVLPRYGSSAACSIAGWERQQPGLAAVGRAVKGVRQSSGKVHLEQTDDSSAAGARGHADPSMNRGELRMPWGGRGWHGSERHPGSTGGWVLSPTHPLTLGTSPTGCRVGKARNGRASNALGTSSQRLCRFCYHFPFNLTNLGGNPTLETLPRFISAIKKSSEILLFYLCLSISS